MEKLDYIQMSPDGVQANGTVAQRLLANGMNPAVLRPYQDKGGKSFVTINGVKEAVNASTLRKDEWKRLDTAVVKVAPQRATIVSDLVSRGLTYSVGGMGTTVLETEKMSDWGNAQLSMDGATRGDRDRPEFDIGYLPMPICHSDFQINTRQLAASRNGNTPLDTTQAENAARKVVEMIEQISFQGASAFAFGGGTLRGLADFPARNTQSIGTDWASDTGANILADVQAAATALRADRAHGPYVMYIPSNFVSKMGDDYVSGYPKTIRQRLLELDYLSDIRTSDWVPASNVFLVQMTSDVIRLVDGMAITTVEWPLEGGMIMNYKVMAIQVPQLRSDFDGRCGYVHVS